jgi:SagB-type dehydrogenase family enzyme
VRNDEVGATWRYHDSTKHSYQSVRSSRHVLDWANQPIPYKIYSSLEPIPLPSEFAPSGVSALDAIAGNREQPAGERLPDLATLARLCFFSNGITRRFPHAHGELAFRATACTGALYHIELYLACGELPDVPAGLYHFGAHDNGLRRLRAGDFRQVLVAATGGESSIVEAPVVVICTSTFWRNAWKYQARAYRHSFWDSGVLLSNFLAVATAAELPARVVVGFVDEQVNQLLDVDPTQEAAVCLVALGRTATPPPPAPPVPPLGLPTAPLSAREVDYPAIWEMHAASSLASWEEAAAWRGPPPVQPLPPSAMPRRPLQPRDTAALPGDSIERVIRRRGSTRRFAREPISLRHLSTMLERTIEGIQADCLGPAGQPLGDPYLIVNAVDGLAPGTYVLRQEDRAFEVLKAGTFRDQAGWLALDQDLGADAAVNLYFLTDLEPLLARFGNRSYRAAQLTSAIASGRVWLAAYALRLGATGLTFFDDDVTTFFSPHAANKSAMFLLAVGQPTRQGLT